MCKYWMPFVLEHFNRQEICKYDTKVQKVLCNTIEFRAVTTHGVQPQAEA